MQEQRVELRDGTVAVVRPIRPDDGPRLRQGLHELSPRSRYLRFHTPVLDLSEAQVRYLTDVDQRDHVAWVAVNPAEPDEPGMGVARYIRLTDEPDVAEAAVTVADRYQGRGLGTVLLGIVAERAATNGVRTLRNYVLEQNASMLEVLDGLGARRVRVEPGVWQVDVDVPEPTGDLPGSPVGRLFRAISTGALGDGWGRGQRAKRAQGRGPSEENAVEWLSRNARLGSRRGAPAPGEDGAALDAGRDAERR